MGIQLVDDVVLIRHAYVHPDHQGAGVGHALLEHLLRAADRTLLVGTWAVTACAIRFYQRHGFALVPSDQVPELFRRYWSIPDRQIETSVVLNDTPLAPTG